MFLLYDQASQRLKAFGWATLANIESPLWEHPRAPFLQVVTCFSTVTSKIISSPGFLVKRSLFRRSIKSLGLTYRTGGYFASFRVMRAYYRSNYRTRYLLFDCFIFLCFNLVTCFKSVAIFARALMSWHLLGLRRSSLVVRPNHLTAIL